MIPGIATNLSSLISQLKATVPSKAAEDNSSGGFGNAFKAAIQQVDDLQTGADQQIGGILQGHAGSDVGNVMASVEKADVAFQLMMQVRNKIVSAYQDIEKMQF